VDILFSRRREVDGPPWLKGGEEIAVPAKRNKGTGRLSAMLAKSVVVILNKSVIGLAQLAEGGTSVRSVSQSGGPNHLCYWLNDGPAAYLPRGNVTYHLGILAMAEALARKDEAHVMVKVANETRRLKRSHELSGCLDPRGLVAWASKFKTRKEEDLLERLKAAARITFMYSMCGADSEGFIREDAMNIILSLIEAHTPK
jgi:hypothetical protein